MDDIYLIYRVYDRRERPDDHAFAPLYGWTDKRDIAKLLRHQRDKKKYLIKSYPSELVDKSVTKCANELDFALMRSSGSDELITVITHHMEAMELRYKLKNIIRDANRLTTDGDLVIEIMVKLFLMLKDHYLDALNTIGFWPLEVLSIYDDVEDYDDRDYDYNENDLMHKFPISLEAFVMVFRDDM